MDIPFLSSNVEEQLGHFSGYIIQYGVPIIGAILIFIVGWFVTGILQRATLKGLSRINGIDSTVAYFLSRTVRYFMLVIIFIMILGQLGVKTTSILAALGGAVLAIGLALKDTLQNIAAGIMLLALRPFRNGEYISAGSVAGTVQEISLFTTDILTPDGIYISAPNSTLWNTPITNYSRMPKRRHNFKVGIGYGDDINKAFGLIKEVVEQQPGVLSDPEPFMFIDQLGDSSVVLAYYYWITKENYYMTSISVNQAVKAAFDKNGISIPFPQVTYHNGDAPMVKDNVKTESKAPNKPKAAKSVKITEGENEDGKDA